MPTLSPERQICRYCGRPCATTADISYENTDPSLCWRAVFGSDTTCNPNPFRRGRT